MYPNWSEKQIQAKLKFDSMADSFVDKMAKKN